jgi:hypothetical protein
VIILLACSSSTEPNGPAIPPVIGQFCASTTPVVTAGTDGRVTVDLSLNTTTYQDVRRSDGVVIRQEVRGCRQFSCSFLRTAGTDAQLISACQQLATQTA